MESLTLNIPPAVGLTDEQFYQLCIANEPWQLELTQADTVNINDKRLASLYSLNSNDLDCIYYAKEILEQRSRNPPSLLL